MLSNEDIPLGRVEFDEFSVKAFDGALRSVDAKDRRNLRQLKLLVSQDTYMSYLEEMASRMGETLGTPPQGLIASNPTYCGIPVVADGEIPDGMIEVYGPPPSEPQQFLNKGPI